MLRLYLWAWVEQEQFAALLSSLSNVSIIRVLIGLELIKLCVTSAKPQPLKQKLFSEVRPPSNCSDVYAAQADQMSKRSIFWLGLDNAVRQQTIQRLLDLCALCL